MEKTDHVEVSHDSQNPSQGSPIAFHVPVLQEVSGLGARPMTWNVYVLFILKSTPP